MDASIDSPGARALAEALAAGPALPRSDWALDDTGLQILLGEVAGGRRRIIECGSGASTILVARMLKARGDGRIQALEHDSGWARKTRASLIGEGLTPYAEVIDAPLRSLATGAAGGQWYEPAALDRLQRDADLLLVDGPPAGEIPGARYPALPMLAGHVASGCLVLLDDTDRDGERRVVECWRTELGVGLRECGPRIAGGEVPSQSRLRGRAALVHS